MKPHYELTEHLISVWIDYPSYRDTYSRDILSIAGSHYNGARKCWEFPITEGNIETLNEVFKFDIGKHKSELAPTPEVKELRRIEFKSPVTPMEHQRVAVDMMMAHEKLALFMEMGTGKTKCVIDWFMFMMDKKEVENMLVICPKAVMSSWVEELTKHNIKNYVLLTGTKKRRLIDMGGAIINIINYEGVLVLEDYLSYFASLKTAVVLDESVKIKSPKAARTKVIVNAFKVNRFKFILSGAPVTQSPIDIYPQYKFLDETWLDFTSWYSFRNYYCITDNKFGFHQIIGYRHLQPLQQKIDAHAYIIKKKDCLDLPPKIYQTRQLDMKPLMSKQYKEMKKNMLIEIAGDDKVTASIILVKLLRLQQILSGRWLEEKNTKLEEFIDIIKLHEGKAVVWCKFVDSIKLISERLIKEQIAHVDFHGATQNRDEVLKSFQTNERFKIFIGQLQTGGMGINLQCADLVVYFENSFSLQDRWQSEDRCHRKGQDNKVTYIDLVYNGTIDEDIIKAIKGKEKIANYLIPAFKVK